MKLINNKSKKIHLIPKPTKFQIINLILSASALVIAMTSLILRLLKLKG